MKKLAAGVVYSFLLISPLRLHAQAAYSNHLIVCGFERQLCTANTLKDATSAGSRLIAEVSGRFVHRAWAQDSTVYTYTGTHGGDYEGSMSMFPIKYDVATTYAADATGSVYTLSGKKIQAFNALDQITSLTGLEWNGSAWVNNDRTLYTYNPAGLNDTITGQIYNASESMWEPIYKITFVYNSSNRVLRSGYDTWNSITDSYDPTELSLYTYAANTTTYLIQLYDPASRTYTNNTRYIYHYNGSNAETAEVHQNYIAGDWVNSDSTSMLLSANLSAENNFYTWATSSASWGKYGHNLIAANAAGKPATSLQENWNFSTNAYAGVTREALSYNQFSQRITALTFNLPAGDPASKARYYYERYATGVENIAGNEDPRINIYPVPAQQFVNISMSFTGSQRIACVISDAAGKVLQEWQADAGDHYMKQVSVSALPSGIYWLKVTTGSDQLRKSFSVVH